jgi:hypothetical protein
MYSVARLHELEVVVVSAVEERRADGGQLTTLVHRAGLRMVEVGLAPVPPGFPMRLRLRRQRDLAVGRMDDPGGAARSTDGRQPDVGVPPLGLGAADGVVRQLGRASEPVFFVCQGVGLRDN